MRERKEVRADLLTHEEIAASDIRIAIMGELIQARNEKHISQRELEKLIGKEFRKLNGRQIPAELILIGGESL